MGARVMRWALTGLLAGTALGVAACEKDDNIHLSDSEVQTSETEAGAKFAEGGEDRPRNPPNFATDRVEEGYVPPPGTGGAGSPPGGGAGTGVGIFEPGPTVPREGTQRARGPGGSGEVVGTGAPPAGPLFGGSGRSDYRGPEPYTTPPQPTPSAQPGGGGPGDRGIQQAPITAPPADSEQGEGGGH